jgi:hypothetical protein
MRSIAVAGCLLTLVGCAGTHRDPVPATNGKAAPGAGGHAALRRPCSP